MTLQVHDRVWDTTTTTGTGAVTLAASPPNAYQDFGAVCANSDTTYYCIANRTANEWETGLGTYSTTGPTLTRTTVLASSNSNSAVNFSAGTKDVLGILPAAMLANGHFVSNPANMPPFGTVSNPDFNIANSAGIYAPAAGSLAFADMTTGLAMMQWNSGTRCGMASNLYFAFNSATNAQGNDDTVLYRDGGASLLGLANATSKTTAVTLRVYNTTDTITTSAPTNYERGVFDWTTTANTLTIGTQAGGTGTLRGVSIVGATLKLGSSGMFTANGTVATAMSSLGPTGSHPTIQTWLTITDSGGTVRYIPCF